MSIQLDFENRTERKTPDPSLFNLWVHKALSKLYTEAELSICIVDKDEMVGLNHQYRGYEKPTNVLSFPADIPPEIGLNLLGDIVICAEVIEQEASQQGKPLEAHYAHMAVHGALHLAGFDHIEINEAEEMEALEKSILTGLGYPNPYADDEHKPIWGLLT